MEAKQMAGDSIRLWENISEEDAEELQGILDSYKTAAEELAKLVPRNIEPNSVDWENFLHEHPEREERITIQLDVMSEELGELLVKMISYAIADFSASLKGAISSIHSGWEEVLTQRIADKPHFRAQLREQIGEVLRELV